MTIASYRSPDEALAITKLVVAELDRTARDRYSSMLVNQLVYMPFEGMSLLYQHVIPEIAHLEDVSRSTRTKEATAFRRQDMRCLWKKHFSLPQFFAQNVMNAWGLRADSRSTQFENTFALDWQAYQRQPSVEAARQVSSDIAQRIIDDARARPQTGEYIIFQKHNDQNYYLCLGGHRSDDAILRWVTRARKDFDFLADHRISEAAP